MQLRSCDLDLDLVTLIHDLDLDASKTYLYSRNDFSTLKHSSDSTVRARMRQTHRHRCDRTHYHAAFAGDKTDQKYTGLRHIGGRSFSAAATSVSNRLPEAVRSSTSLALFRKTLKTKLFP